MGAHKGPWGHAQGRSDTTLATLIHSVTPSQQTEYWVWHGSHSPRADKFSSSIRRHPSSNDVVNWLAAAVGLAKLAAHLPHSHLADDRMRERLSALAMGLLHLRISQAKENASVVQGAFVEIVNLETRVCHTHISARIWLLRE